MVLCIIIYLSRSIMRSSPYVSVIVPVYNKQEYLHQCIESVLSQSFNDFELLLIDDGSIDSSSTICDEYAKQDPRITVYHKLNGGVSSARNLGLDVLRGQYVVFVDSDDTIGTGYIASLIPNRSEDFIIDSSDQRSPKMNDAFYEGKSAIDKALVGWHILCPWGKMYKTDIISNRKIRFDESLKGGEDTLFNIEFLKYVSLIRTASSAGYNYNVDVTGSLSRAYTSIADAVYKATKVYNLGKELSRKFSDPLIEVEVSKYAGITWTLWHSLSQYKIAERANEVKAIWSNPDMRSLLRNYLNCPESGKKYALFYWFGQHCLFRLASCLIP